MPLGFSFGCTKLAIQSEHLLVPFSRTEILNGNDSEEERCILTNGSKDQLVPFFFRLSENRASG